MDALLPPERARVPVLWSGPDGGRPSLELARAAVPVDALGHPRAQLWVTSEKALKWRPALDFVFRSLRAAWPLCSADAVAVTKLTCDSGVAPQPIGRPAGIEGARGRARDPRISAAKAAAITQGDLLFVVSIENTIAFERLDLGSWSTAEREAYVHADGSVAVDRAAVLVEVVCGDAFEAITFSDGVCLPRRFVDAARAATADPAPRSGYDVTAGAFIEAELGVPSDDWHARLSGCSRDALLDGALRRIDVRWI